MGGQVLGGGVIVLVAVLLWLVYLLPSWYSRRQYDASERNAVRLSQALRVLAETSETPEEVRLELTARTALQQQKLARRAMAQREQAALEEARVELQRARDERVAARLTPEARRARARRRVRFASMLLLVTGLGVAGWGVWQLVTTGAQALVWAGGAAAVLALATLHRMSRVGARAVARRSAPVVERPATVVQDVALEPTKRSWAPRELPRPLASSAGSRAAAVLDAREARDALRRAAIAESMREAAEAAAPPSIETARTARVSESSFTRMGYVDDAEIEAHVRDVLSRRAAGQ
ncbi:large exoprotein [Microbacterium koreense]|uniref:Large exoprotein n=1 Tax=Microbacterium koreense TaxID=323761 RepID=A0ABW2ZQP3_9MICO